MAPRFKVNMYKIWEKEERIECLICFSNDSIDLIFNFRDMLIEYLIKNQNLELIKEEGSPTDYDSISYLFKKNDIDSALAKHTQKFPIFPGLFHWVFKTRKYKNYRFENNRIAKDEEDLNAMVMLSIYTSHDHPCIEIYGKTNFKNCLDEYIKNIAIKLGIKIYINDNLNNMRDIICSNKEFDI